MFRTIIKTTVVLAAFSLPLRAYTWVTQFYLLPGVEDPGDSTASYIQPYGDSTVYLSINLDTWDEAVDSIEYFIDTDPGIGRGIYLTGSNWYHDQINLGLLSPGLHTLYVRAKDLAEWNAPFTKTIYVMPDEKAAVPPVLTVGEYFLDSNTAPGAGTPFTIPAATTDADTTVTVDLTVIPAGLRQVYFRVKDGSDTWSLPFRTLVLNEGSAPTDPSPLISEAEYYIDTDPGFGMGTAFTMPADSSGDSSYTADLSSVSVGMHILYTRVRDADGTWSLSHSRPFTNEGSIPTDPSPLLAGGEFFVDTDPGFGSGTPFTLAADSLIDTTVTAPLSAVSSGLHVLYTRTRDANGSWSLALGHPFLNMASGILDPSLTITTLEYFIDTDPGFGAGIPVTLTADSLLDLSATLDISMLSTGIHSLYLRAKDENGNWSSPQRYRFIVEQDGSLPVISTVDYSFIKNGTVMGSGSYTPAGPAADISSHFRANMCGLDMDSTYEYHVQAVDADGRRSLVITADSVTLTEEGPAVFVDVPSETITVPEDFATFVIDLDTVFGTSLCQPPGSLDYTVALLDSLPEPDTADTGLTQPLKAAAAVFDNDTLDWQLDSSSLTFRAIPDSYGITGLVATAANDTGYTAADTFFVRVQAVNDVPVVTSPGADTARYQTAYRYIVTSADGDPGDLHTVSYGPLPGWMQAAGDTLTGMPSVSDTDTVVTVYVSDSVSTGSLHVQLAVRARNDSLRLTSYTKVKAYETEPFIYTAAYTGTDTVVTVTWQDLAGWLTADGDTISGTPPVNTDDTVFTVIAAAGLQADTLVCTLLVDTVPQVVTVDPSFDPDTTADTLADSVSFVAISYLSVSAVQFTIDVATLVDTTIQGVALEYKMAPRDSFDSAVWLPVGFGDTSIVYTHLEPGDYKFALLLLGVVRDSTVDSILFTIRSKEYPLVGNWDLLSVPHNVLDRSVNQLLGGSIDVYRWDETAGMDRYYLKYRKQSSLLKGASYWVRGDTTDTIDISSVDYYQDDTVTVSLQQGWNQISNPFSYGINWQKLLVKAPGAAVPETVGSTQSMVEKTIWLYTGAGYQPDSTMFLPWEGYFVYAPAACTLQMRSPEPYFRAAPKEGRTAAGKTDGSCWRMRLTASCAGKTDAFNTIGTAADARTGYDGHDLTGPVTEMGEYIALSLVNPVTSGQLASDIRPAGTCGSWAFTVTGSRGGYPVTISWDRQADGTPPLYLVDLSDGTVTDMNAAAEYTYTGKRGASAEFIITPEMTDAARSLFRSGRYITNAPNPFRDRTSLLYRFPVSQLQAASGSIRILNQQGITVHTIPVSAVSADPREISLPAGFLAPGTYFYELSTSAGWKTTGRMIRVQ